MSLRLHRVGPVYIANSVGNLFNPPTYSGGVNAPANGMYGIISHMRIVNKDTSQRTFTLYCGATGGSAGGTEIVGASKTISANDVYDWYGEMRVDIADFITGVADAASKLVITMDTELGVAG